MRLLLAEPAAVNKRRYRFGPELGRPPRRWQTGESVRAAVSKPAKRSTGWIAWPSANGGNGRIGGNGPGRL